MLIKSSSPSDARPSEITPRDLYLNRRKFLAGVGLSAIAAAGVGTLLSPAEKAMATDQITGLQKSPFSTTEKITPMNDVTHYNNYYEFSSEKDEPASLAKNFKSHPWTVSIGGAVPKKLKWDID